LKYETTPAFEGDVRRLSAGEYASFREVVIDKFIPAAERKAADPAARWPRSLRVRTVEGAPGIWEMTWSFAGPDGRATFEWIEIEGEKAIRWRRVGSHEIFREP
jgi:hypothetical protein